MTTRAASLIAALLALALSLLAGVTARAAEEADAIAAAPPRLSYADGEVSFWRPGSPDWAPARVNTPLAPGDELYTGHQGNLELQVGGRAFVRAWGDTHLGLSNQEPDFLQIKVTSGHVSVDLRSVDPGHTVELDTPHGAFIIEHAGYYRADVTQERTSFITRRTGRATATPLDGQAIAIAPSENVVLGGAAAPGATAPTVQSYVAPPLDVWDRWNYARTDSLLEAVSSRYVPPSVYGVDDLDHYGNWRVVPTYGAVWVPDAVPAGWAPYTTGRWVWDPRYGWTWVDTMRWGWAPFHYGRWVYVDGFWAWAPGPIVARPVYAPALVAFFGGPGVRVAIGPPAVGWVALGWGEPVVPWWGGERFVGRPWWGGWGGPRVVNNVVISRTTVVNVTTITTYRNATVQNAVVAVRQEQFGRRAVAEARMAQVDVRALQPVHGPLPVAPAPASFVAASGPTVRPPEPVATRRVVATRPPAAVVAPEPAPRAERQAPAVTPRGQGQPPAAAPAPALAPGLAPAPGGSRPAPHIVSVPPKTPESVPAWTPPPGKSRAPASAAPGDVSRPPFAVTGPERPKPPLPPRFEPRPGDVAPERAPRPQGQPAPRPEARPSSPVPPPKGAAVTLPGEPANRLYPGRAEPQPRQPEKKPTPDGQPGPTPGPSKERSER